MGLRGAARAHGLPIQMSPCPGPPPALPQTSVETAALLIKKPFLFFRDPQTQRPALCLTCALRVTGRKEPGTVPCIVGGGHYFLILAPAPTWLQISRPDHALGPCSLPASWNGEPGLSPPVTLVSWVMPAHAPDRPVLIPRTCECDCIRQEIFFFFLQM